MEKVLQGTDTDKGAIYAFVGIKPYSLKIEINIPWDDCLMLYVFLITFDLFTYVSFSFLISICNCHYSALFCGVELEQSKYL